MSFKKDIQNITKLEACEQYKILKNNLSNFNGPLTEEARKQDIINLLHEYNEIKDVCQNVLGVLANLEQRTIKQMHLLHGLPLNE
ncbi:DNA repair protein SWI5 homolog [Glossina fuscipes]|uniref:DNA repair protein SWI5 homolog n=1 Tax=Glossina fuscipes TaxID=7396 RepID=A0A9C5Z1C1_9MUSC|nr:DNA repair protein SWI5 homolog [Glossina fuscipes]